MSLETIRQELARISYEDGSILRVQLENEGAALDFKDWRERLWHLEFGEVVLLRAYEFGGDVSEVIASDDSEAITDAVAELGRNGTSGRRADYPNLVAVDFWGNWPMVTVVFQTLQISSVRA